jgi:hypothetical protein
MNQNTVDSIINRQDQAEDIIAGMENKVKEILCSDNNEEKRMKQP